ncbi:MAG TPA: acetoacetate--CoA ligase [Actinocrinis sp.]|uniref:acetoacetate--CoA ligase n=1 Tax=Actinocrinis sp. TaxID=1920516 RepID=UPI002DDD1214|nr:acetoacetate--CoA ligase [Actinocrinis sp.]HEV3173611.1 acetoacetate--CoA ligase [Actinocrinis sp.]
METTDAQSRKPDDVHGGAPAPVWTPSPTDVEGANVERFRARLAGRGVHVADYRELHAWSAREPEAFWGELWDFFSIEAATPGRTVLESREMPGASWFPGATLNYVSQVLRPAQRSGVAIIDAAEPGGDDDNAATAAADRTVSWAELRRQVGAVAHTLRGLGVGQGDRVVGYLPNIPEAVVAFLATASLGAIWSSCGQDYSAAAAAARLGQLDPMVLIAADGYRYGGKAHDKRSSVAELRESLGSLQATIVVPRLGLDLESAGLGDAITWDAAAQGEDTVEPVAVPFDHPLWVLFSSGTTGKPKGIVHGHGGVLLEHLKQIAFHLNLKEDEPYFWYTSPSWMMWNFQVAGLLVGATIVCYDGSPSHPGPGTLWELAARHRVVALGTSPAYLQATEKAGVRPAAQYDLSRLRVLGVTGSVLPAASYHWAAREVGPRVQVVSTSGGTDVVSAFIGGAPTVPVYPGEISVPCLGVALDAFGPGGESVRDEVGELVITAPLPSMPVFFWNDPDGARYRAAYFDTYPGVWRHGDWITITGRGTIVVHGRSDSTLNRNGIRMGSADIYQVVEQFPEVREALVIGAEEPGGGYWMPLFVALADGARLTDELADRIRAAIRTQASPRHVPDEIIAVAGIPHTRTGKKLEVPIKRLLQGAAPGDVLDSQSVDDATLLEVFAQLGKARAARGQ